MVGVAILLGGLGGAETARAAQAGPLPRGFAAPADTDSVAAPPRRDAVPGDSAGLDTLGRSSTDSAAVFPDSVRSDTLEVDQEGPPFPERDDVLQRLAGLPGFRVIEYRGRDVELDVQEETVRLRREAQAKYATSVLDADSLTY